MDAATRAAVIREFIDTECLPLLDSKGAEYGGKQDDLAHFKLLGQWLRWALQQGGHDVPFRTCAGLVLMIEKLKHGLSELKFAATWKEGAEPIVKRIADDQNYGLLLRCLILELKENEE